MDYEQFMRLAIEVGKQNPKAPFGAVLVNTDTQEAVATGLNQSASNPLLHGEIVAINNYASLEAQNWSKLTLFTTAEPCCMCQAAIIWAGIPTVVFGTSIVTLSKLGWRQFNLYAQHVVDAASFSECQLVGGVLGKQCDQIFNRKE